MYVRLVAFDDRTDFRIDAEDALNILFSEDGFVDTTIVHGSFNGRIAGRYDTENARSASFAGLGWSRPIVMDDSAGGRFHIHSCYRSKPARLGVSSHS